MKTIIGFGLFLAVLIGIICGLSGGVFAVMLFLLLFPVLFILGDYRIGVVGLLLFYPFAQVRALPQIPGLNIVTVLAFVTLGAFLLRKVLFKSDFINLPVITWWRYALPLAFAAVWGMFHLGEMTTAMVLRLGAEYGSKWLYFVGFGIKPMFLVVTCWLLANAVRDSKRPERFLVPMVISMLALALLMLGYLAVIGHGLRALSSPSARELLSPLGLHSNQFGALFGCSLGICVFMWPAVQSKFYRFLLGGVILVIGLALVLTFSRGGWVCGFIGLAYFLYSQRRLGLALGGVAVLVAGLALAPDSIMERVSYGFGQGAMAGGRTVLPTAVKDDELTAGRVWLWRQTFPTFFRHPVIGGGLSSQAWSDAAKKGVIPTSHTHNMYLSILYDTGLVGMVLILSFYAFMFRSFLRIGRRAGTPPVIAAALQGGAAALLGMAAMSFTNGLCWPQPEHYWMWMLFGLCAAYMSKEERDQSSQVFRRPASLRGAAAA